MSRRRWPRRAYPRRRGVSRVSSRRAAHLHAVTQDTLHSLYTYFNALRGSEKTQKINRQPKTPATSHRDARRRRRRRRRRRWRPRPHAAMRFLQPPRRGVRRRDARASLGARFFIVPMGTTARSTARRRRHRATTRRGKDQNPNHQADHETPMVR